MGGQNNKNIHNVNMFWIQAPTLRFLEIWEGASAFIPPLDAPYRSWWQSVKTRV